jgi:hypothetical protein
LALSAFAAAGLGGAAMLATALRAVALVVSPPVWLPGAVALTLLPVALVVHPLRLPQSRWRIPREWGRFGSVTYAAAFGVGLGSGVILALPAVGFYFVLVAGLALQSSEAFALIGIFGLVRVLPLLVAARSASRSGDYPLAVTDRLSAMAGDLRLLEAALLAAVGAAWIALGP